jgi:thiamine biosynthesis lipoprotein
MTSSVIRGRIVLLLAPVVAVALVSCRAADDGDAAPGLLSRSHLSMGSPVTISAWTADEASAEKAIRAAFAEFDRLDALLSVWKPGSDVVRLNAAAGQTPVRVSPETLEVLEAARQASEWTDGKFDITFGALADVWKFDHDQDNRVPAREDVAARVPLVDYRAVVIDRAAATAFVSRRGMRVHLGGIGKGYAVDRAVAILRAGAVRDFLLQAGGDLYASGQRGDTPWRLGIQDPRGESGDHFASIELRDRTFSTSGDYERFFIEDGRRYHHLLDPDSGEPARECVSVTIVAPSAIVADALSTGVFILGPDEGMALVEQLPDVEAVIVTAANDVRISSGLRGRVQILRSPTLP